MIALTDILYYLEGRKDAIPVDEYMERVREIKKYCLLIPGFGINGIVLGLGFSMYCFFHKIPYWAFWSAQKGYLPRDIMGILEEDIPIVLGIGPNFPLFWGKHKVTLYKKVENDRFVEQTQTKAHYVVITGIEDKWIRISSWGKEYYIDWNAFERYRKKYSCCFVSNICKIKLRRKGVKK